MKTISSTIEAALAAESPTPEEELIRSVYWYALSLGQERAEASIRSNLATVEYGRYHNEQRRAIEHALRDNPCAVKAPVSPDYAEIGSWEVSS